MVATSAVLISNSEYAEKRMYIGKKFANKTFIDAMGNMQDEVMIDEEGIGNFKVNGKSVSIWINKYHKSKRKVII